MSVGPVQRDDATAEFFDAAAAGRFLLRRCPAGHVSEPATAQCPACHSTDLLWIDAGGGASLVSWAISWSRPPEGGGEPRKTVLVIGELDEGPWWWTQLAADGVPAVSELTPGRRLRIEFRRADTEHEAVPVFVLA